MPSRARLCPLATHAGRYAGQRSAIRSTNRLADPDLVPFEDAEEAWFWFIRCQKMRDSGVRSAEGMQSVCRPCEPDDLYRLAKKLHREKRLHKGHIQTMTRYGLGECPPDPRDRDQEQAARLWADAMDRMTGPLRQKGIVASVRMPELVSEQESTRGQNRA